jgi:hypothetical protein
MGPFLPGSLQENKSTSNKIEIIERCFCIYKTKLNYSKSKYKFYRRKKLFFIHFYNFMIVLSNYFSIFVMFERRLFVTTHT